MPARVQQQPLFLGNKSLKSKECFKVFDKYSGKSIAEVSLANTSIIEKAIEFADNAKYLLRDLSAFERKEVLEYCVISIEKRRNEFIDILCAEVGKVKKDAIGEVARTLNTFKIAAEESTRIYGEVLPLDIGARGKNYQGFWKRIPIGPCLFITPFNFPLNLVAHKIAPAIAVGCPFILKPSKTTPLSALLLGEILAETNLPVGSFSILPCESESAKILLKAPQIKLLSFTGSVEVGWQLKSEACKKQVILELGGNAACIVDEKVDLDYVTERLVWGAFYTAGQSCISVQRVFIHQNIYSKLCKKLIAKIRTLKVGNPRLEATDVGPMISLQAAKRLEKWITEAINAGAKLLCGGSRQGAIVEPTLMENVANNQKLSCEEAFGPIMILKPFKDFSNALKETNESRYGLQAGIFTQNLDKAYLAFKELEVGGVIINDVPSWRSDNMPYGGTKDSGVGREGLRFAIEHLTEIKMMAMHFNF